MLKEIIFILWLEVCHVEGVRNSRLPWKIYLVSIVVNLLKHFKWSFSTRY